MTRTKTATRTAWAVVGALALGLASTALSLPPPASCSCCESGSCPRLGERCLHQRGRTQGCCVKPAGPGSEAFLAAVAEVDRAVIPTLLATPPAPREARAAQGTSPRPTEPLILPESPPPRPAAVFEA